MSLRKHVLAVWLGVNDSLPVPQFPYLQDGARGAVEGVRGGSREEVIRTVTH